MRRRIRFAGLVGLWAGIAGYIHAQQPQDVSGLVWQMFDKKTGVTCPAPTKLAGAPIWDIAANAQFDRSLYPGDGINGLFPQIEYTGKTCHVSVVKLDAKGNPVPGAAWNFTGGTNNINGESSCTTSGTNINPPGTAYSGFATGTYRVTLSTGVKITYAPGSGKNPVSRGAQVVGNCVVP